MSARTAPSIDPSEKRVDEVSLEERFETLLATLLGEHAKLIAAIDERLEKIEQTLGDSNGKPHQTPVENDAQTAQKGESDTANPLLAHWREFCNASAMNGFGFIASAQNVRGALFWTFAMLACVCLCIRDTTSIVQDFMAEKTVTSTVMHTDHALNLSELGVCFRLDHARLRDKINETYDEAFLNQSLALIAARGKRVDLSTLDGTSFPSPDRLMEILYVYLAQIIEYDLSGPSRAHCGDDLCTLSENVQQATDLVSGFFSSANYSLVELVEYTARYICRKVSFWEDARVATFMFLYQNEPEKWVPIDMCNRSIVSWFGHARTLSDDGVCFSWNAREFPPLFSRPEDLLQIGRNQSWNSFGRIWRDDVVVVDLRAPASLLNPKRSAKKVYIRTDLHTTVYVNTLSRFVKAYNRSMRRCDDETEHACTLRCLGNERRLKDGCWPLAARSLAPANVTICNQRLSKAETRDIVQRAQNGSRIETTWRRCVDACESHECEITTYGFDTHTYNKEGNSIMTVRQGGFDYPIMEEQIAMTLANFIANIGGLIGKRLR